jgi:3-mercaptopyruvate sulfurtransferase SseA
LWSQKSTAEAAGVSADKDVVLIDPGHMMAASQAWIWLRNLGLKRLFVVNGGVGALASTGLKGLPTQPISKPSSLKTVVPDNSVGFVTMEDVKSRSNEVQVRRAFEVMPPALA